MPAKKKRRVQERKHAVRFAPYRDASGGFLVVAIDSRGRRVAERVIPRADIDGSEYHRVSSELRDLLEVAEQHITESGEANYSAPIVFSREVQQ